MLPVESNREAPLKHLLYATFIAAIASPAQAQTTREITAADLLHRVGVLAHDSMLGRDAGQIGNVRATNYVARELARLGLAPAGTEGFFQAVPTVLRGPMADATLTVGGNSFGADGVLSLRALGGSPLGGVFRGTHVETVFGGSIANGALIDPAATAGKVVIFNAMRNAAGQIPATLAGQNGVLAPYANAAGILIVGMDDLAPQTLASLRGSRFGLAGAGAASPVREIPSAIITNAVAQQILGVSYRDAQVGAAGAVISGTFGMIDVPTPQPARNVVAILRGTDTQLRNEYIAIGAHTDHVGVGPAVDHDSVRAANEVLRPLGANGQPRRATDQDLARIRSIRDSLARRHVPRRDSIFNGADDDASGTAVALELTEYFARHPLKRSLLFVFHTAEEKGLFGAMYYTDNPTVPLASIVAQINMDQVSRGGPADVAGSEPNTVYLLGTRRLSTQLGDLVETLNAKPEHRLRLDYTLDAPGHPANGYCRSDHYMYARYGIPIVFLSAGWHRDYHMVTDETQYVQPETMLNIADLVRDLTASVGDAAMKPVVDKPKNDPRGVCRQ